LLNNDKWASFCCNPIIHIFSQRLMGCSLPPLGGTGAC
jgi:hypothetical protein